MPKQVTSAPQKHGPFSAGTLSDKIARVSVATGSATVTPDGDAYGCYLITATDTAAITVANPIGTFMDGQLLDLVFLNASGGTLGNVTFGAKFKVASFTKPANGFNRTVHLRYDETADAWRQLSSAADVAN